MKHSKPVLVVGATGYVGGRLVPRLLEAGYRVRALARSRVKLDCRPWARNPSLEIIEGDVLDLDSLRRATEGCWAAFYLVHSMISAQNEFKDKDRLAAKNMIVAAEEAGLERIIYLGGLGNDKDPSLSKHLRSRQEVGKILQMGRVPATVLRAAMILGSGSASFELLRYLVDRLPVMLTPPWVHTLVQPIAIGNVLGYLQGCLEHDETIGETFDIGGPDVVTYQQLFDLYAEVAGLPKRHIVKVPFLNPSLSAWWIHLITPIPGSIAQPLGAGLLNEVVCRDVRIRSIIPQKLLTCRETIALALEKIEQQRVDTCWTDAGPLLPPEWTACGDADYAGGTLLECGYRMRLEATPEEVWQPVVKIGGDRGWYFADPLWRVRGFLDKLMGGVGLERGRRHPDELHPGDALDFWRVLEVDPPHKLVLLAEMKTPGEAILEFRINPIGNGQTELQQLSRFMPRGLAGLAYWYSLLPLHEVIFGGMMRSIADKVGKPIVHGPEPFTSKDRDTCKVAFQSG